MFRRLLACILDTSRYYIHTYIIYIIYWYNIYIYWLYTCIFLVKSLWLIHFAQTYDRILTPFISFCWFYRFTRSDVWGLSDCCCAVGWRTHEGWHSLVHCRIVLVEGNGKQKILYQLATGSYTHLNIGMNNEWLIRAKSKFYTVILQLRITKSTCKASSAIHVPSSYSPKILLNSTVDLGKTLEAATVGLRYSTYAIDYKSQSILYDVHWKCNIQDIHIDHNQMIYQ